MTELTLFADGFHWTLLPAKETRVSSGYFAGTASIVASTALAVSSIPNTYSFRTAVQFPMADLARLRDWMNQHTQDLLDRGDTILSPGPSRAWIPLDRSMQVQLLSGEIEQESGRLVGSYSLTVLLRVGTDPRTGRSVFGGLQGEVPIQSALDFCRAIDTFISFEPDVSRRAVSTPKRSLPS